MWSLNPHSSKWIEIQAIGSGPWPAPSSRSDHGLAGAGSKLYLFGGYSGGHLKDLWAFSTAYSTWARLASGAPGPSARTYPGFASSGGLLYVLGGRNFEAAARSSSSSSGPRERASSTLDHAPVWQGRHVRRDLSLSAGAHSLRCVPLTDLWAYDPAQDAWSDRTSSVQGGGTWPREGGGAGGLLDVAGELLSVNMQPGAGIAPAN